jgi:hypothetical protein
MTFFNRTTFLKRYCQFLNELEQISKEHDELTDTDVRERLHEVINYYFIWEKPLESDFPKRFAMFSTEGDKKVFKTVHRFINDAIKLARAEGLEIGDQRNSAIENPKALTSTGNSYDLFLGSSDSALAPEKPSADSIYDEKPKDTLSLSKNQFDLSLLTVEVEGHRIQPNYNAEIETYDYVIPNVVTVGVKGDTVETVRNNAIKKLAESISFLKKISSYKS